MREIARLLHPSENTNSPPYNHVFQDYIKRLLDTHCLFLIVPNRKQYFSRTQTLIELSKFILLVTSDDCTVLLEKRLEVEQNANASFSARGVLECGNQGKESVSVIMWSDNIYLITTSFCVNEA